MDGSASLAIGETFAGRVVKVKHHDDDDDDDDVDDDDDDDDDDDVNDDEEQCAVVVVHLFCSFAIHLSACGCGGIGIGIGLSSNFGGCGGCIHKSQIPLFQCTGNC